MLCTLDQRHELCELWALDILKHSVGYLEAM